MPHTITRITSLIVTIAFITTQCGLAQPAPASVIASSSDEVGTTKQSPRNLRIQNLEQEGPCTFEVPIFLKGLSPFFSQSSQNLCSDHIEGAGSAIGAIEQEIGSAASIGARGTVAQAPQVTAQAAANEAPAAETLTREQLDGLRERLTKKGGFVVIISLDFNENNRIIQRLTDCNNGLGLDERIEFKCFTSPDEALSFVENNKDEILMIINRIEKITEYLKRILPGIEIYKNVLSTVVNTARDIYNCV